MVCTAHQISSQEQLNGWGTKHVRGEYTQGLMGKPERKMSHGKSRRRWEYSIKIYIQKIE
jgi:hypothetical protein